MSLFWKLYFLVIVCITLFASISRPPTQPYEWLSKGVLMVSLAGLFAFAFHIRLISAGFWKVWLAVHFIREGYEYFKFSSVAIPLSSTNISMTLALALVIALPMYIALILYAFLSPEIWQQIKIRNGKAKCR